MLTVLLATRNRAQILEAVLQSYCSLEAPASGWKLVVVDNGSTDNTIKILESFRNRLPLQFLVESKLGKNFALNAGLELIEGDLTIFTDDDAFPRSDWLVQLRKAADANSGISLFGGVIVARWELSPPNWVFWIEDLAPVFTITDTSLNEGPVSAVELFGPNMAVRSSVFCSGTRFDTTIGPQGSSYAMGSETELLLRLERQGHKGWHVREAVVEHFIRREQLDKEWLLQRAVRLGRGRQRLSPDVKLWGSMPRHLYRDLPKEALQIALARVTMRKEAEFRARWRFNFLVGKGIEARILARQRRASAQSTSEMTRKTS